MCVTLSLLISRNNYHLLTLIQGRIDRVCSDESTRQKGEPVMMERLIGRAVWERDNGGSMVSVRESISLACYDDLARSVTPSLTEIESKSRGEVLINVNTNGERVGRNCAR